MWASWWWCKRLTPALRRQMQVNLSMVYEVISRRARASQRNALTKANRFMSRFTCLCTRFTQEPLGTRRWCWSFWKRSYRKLWVTSGCWELNPGPLIGTASALDWWALSAAPVYPSHWPSLDTLQCVFARALTFFCFLFFLRICVCSLYVSTPPCPRFFDGGFFFFFSVFPLPLLFLDSSLLSFSSRPYRSYRDPESFMDPVAFLRTWQVIIFMGSIDSF